MSSLHLVELEGDYHIYRTCGHKAIYYINKLNFMTLFFVIFYKTAYLHFTECSKYTIG